MVEMTPEHLEAQVATEWFKWRFDREIQLGGVVKHRLLLAYVF